MSKVYLVKATFKWPAAEQSTDFMSNKVYHRPVDAIRAMLDPDENNDDFIEQGSTYNLKEFRDFLESIRTDGQLSSVDMGDYLDSFEKWYSRLMFEHNTEDWLSEDDVTDCVVLCIDTEDMSIEQARNWWY